MTLAVLFSTPWKSGKPGLSWKEVFSLNFPIKRVRLHLNVWVSTINHRKKDQFTDIKYLTVFTSINYIKKCTLEGTFLNTLSDFAWSSYLCIVLCRLRVSFPHIWSGKKREESTVFVLPSVTAM